jgi:hypothetical protein
VTNKLTVEETKNQNKRKSKCNGREDKRRRSTS